VIEWLAEPAACMRHFGGQHRHGETQRPQQRRKETVGFITKAAAPTLDDLRKQSFVIENDWFMRVNTQVLEGHRVEMREL
jgi:hypothetical protein